jgi:hypothetical protein
VKKAEPWVARALTHPAALPPKQPAKRGASAFTIGEGVKLLPVGELVHVSGPPSGFTVLGAGKTAMDACSFLLDNGVDSDNIRWVRPRDAWLMYRSSWQPLDLVASTVESLSLVLQSLAEAENLDDLFRRLEESGQLLRLDPAVEPTMFRGAIVSVAEHHSLKQIERVVRHGRIRRIDTNRIVLDEGEVPSGRNTIHGDCTADGLRATPPRPIFEAERITPQSLMGGFTTFNAAMVGFVEAARDDDADKNRLCPPTAYPTRRSTGSACSRAASGSSPRCPRSPTWPPGWGPAGSTPRDESRHGRVPGRR